jgi:hypothetical protein
MGWLDRTRTGLMKAHEWAELEQDVGSGTGDLVLFCESPERD